jgi:molybdopterin synthase catalytic subunit
MFALVHGPIDAEAIREAVTDPSTGAVLTFCGVARDSFEGRLVERLEYEAYPEMAIPAMEAIGRDVCERWPGARVAIVHRLGVVATRDISVVIAVATPHRAACYEASRYAIEALKASVPIWKKEITVDGSAWKANSSG